MYEDVATTTDEELSDIEHAIPDVSGYVEFMTRFVAALNVGNVLSLQAEAERVFSSDCCLRTSLMQPANSPCCSRIVPRERMLEYFASVSDIVPDSVWTVTEWKFLPERRAIGFNFMFSGTLIKEVFDNLHHSRFISIESNTPTVLEQDTQVLNAVGTFVWTLNAQSRVQLFEILTAVEYDDDTPPESAEEAVPMTL